MNTWIQVVKFIIKRLTPLKITKPKFPMLLKIWLLFQKPNVHAISRNLFCLEQDTPVKAVIQCEGLCGV